MTFACFLLAFLDFSVRCIKVVDVHVDRNLVDLHTVATVLHFVQRTLRPCLFPVGFLIKIVRISYFFMLSTLLIILDMDLGQNYTVS